MISLEKLLKTEWNIREIEALTEPEARELADEQTEYKEHNIYFIDFPGAFGFSYCVFRNGKHIYHANDYELHHSSIDGRESLKQYYIQTIKNKLFEDLDFAKPLSDYNDYERKSNYLRDCYGQQEDYISAFYIGEQNKPNTDGMIFDSVNFAYYSPEQIDFVKKHYELLEQLQAQRAAAQNDYNYIKNAFVREMYNHEYCINSYQRNYDVLSCFYPNVEYRQDDYNIDGYFRQLNLSEMERRAYRDARAEVRKNWKWD